MSEATALDRAAEQNLARSAQAGNREALQQLLARHETLVAITARRYLGLGVSGDDLLSEGRLALIHAMQRFDPDRGVRFTTYARWWVRAFIMAYASTNRRIVSPPGTRTLRSLSHCLTRVRHEHEQRQKGPVSTAELAELLGVNEEDVAVAQSVLERRDVPLRPAAAGSGGLDLPAEDKLPEDALAEAEERHVARAAVRRGLRELDRRERYIVRERHLRDESRSLQSLADELGVSRERVRQLEARALRKMRGALGDRRPGAEAVPA